MAKKKKKKKQASSPPAKPKNRSLLPGLGGEPEEGMGLPETGSISRNDMERWQRVIAQKIEAEGIEDIDEANAYLSTFLEGKTIDEILDEEEVDPKHRALDLAFAALEAETAEEALVLCGRAIENDPGCLDALTLIAVLTTDTDEDYISRMRKLIAHAESDFGEEYMRENRGHFWGMLDTRPYMRARASLVATLDMNGQILEAITEAEEMLELNPNDNQGMRDVLRGLYLMDNNLAGVRRLRKEYPESMFAISAWSHVLERFLSGEIEAAKTAATQAHKNNPFVVGFLTRKKRLPASMPDGYAIGSREEALVCCGTIGDAWGNHRDAVKWLKSLAALR